MKINYWIASLCIIGGILLATDTPKNKRGVKRSLEQTDVPIEQPRSIRDIFFQELQDNNMDLIKALLRTRPEMINAQDHEGNTPLIKAIQNPDLIDAADYFIRRPQLNINLQNRYGATALMVAAEELDSDDRLFSDIFVIPDLNVDIQGIDGRNALFFAVQKNKLPLLNRLLAESTTHLNTPVGSMRLTPLIVAADKGYIEIVSRLLQVTGININASTSNGLSALRAAASASNDRIHLVIAQLLLDNGAAINAADKEGHTALWYATRYLKEDAKKNMQNLLMRYGAKE